MVTGLHVKIPESQWTRFCGNLTRTLPRGFSTGSETAQYRTHHSVSKKVPVTRRLKPLRATSLVRTFARFLARFAHRFAGFRKTSQRFARFL